MTTEQKLKRTLECVDEIEELIEGNEYQSFLYQHLISIQVELQRQLTNLSHRSKIKE